MTQAFYRTWRPRKWDEVVGQQHIVQTLRNAVAGERVAHAYLFAGPRGTGKTTVARLLAKAVNCLAEDLSARPCNTCAHCQAVNEGRFLDLIEIDAASQTGVDDVRDLRDKINFSPNQGRYKVYIIDEVHMFSTNAFNALLKTLEEPPPHAIFILATTELHKIPATVLSRCQRHEFRRLPVNDIVAQLEKIVKSEKLKADPDALVLIARQAAGGLRDAISLLDQLASTGKSISLEITQTVLGTATSQSVLQMVEAVLSRDPASGFQALHAALDAGADARLLARQVVDYLRMLLLIQMGNGAQVDLAAEVRTRAESQAKQLSPTALLGMIKIFNASAFEQRSGWQPSLPLELALAEAIEVPAAAASAPAAVREAAPRASNPDAGTGSKPEKTAPKPPVRKEAHPPAEKVTESAESSVTLEQVMNVWKQIKLAIKKKSPALEALLNSGRPLEVKDGVLVIGFASDLLRSKVDTPEQVETARKVIAEVIGQDLPVRCVVSSAKQSAPADIKADGMVAAALKAGGEIVDVQD
jgi:DNA polymerase-3 subunit gamma/tau